MAISQDDLDRLADVLELQQWRQYSVVLPDVCGLLEDMRNGAMFASLPEGMKDASQA